MDKGEGKNDRINIRINRLVDNHIAHWPNYKQSGKSLNWSLRAGIILHFFLVLNEFKNSYMMSNFEDIIL